MKYWFLHFTSPILGVLHQTTDFHIKLSSSWMRDMHKCLLDIIRSSFYILFVVIETWFQSVCPSPKSLRKIHLKWKKWMQYNNKKDYLRMTFSLEKEVLCRHKSLMKCKYAFHLFFHIWANLHLVEIIKDCAYQTEWRRGNVTARK